MLSIIGGSGLYELKGVKVIEKLDVNTPFGQPSAQISLCEYQGIRFFFLPRHGTNHQIQPSLINYRANIFAIKSLGAKALLSVSAVGSLREELEPGKLTLVTDFIDFTRKRHSTFFESCVVHWSPVPLICPTLYSLSKDTLISVNKLRQASLISDKCVYVCIEGPRFSTRAESEMFRILGADLIGMTACPEAILAKEAGIGYVNLAVITDYDCWRDSAVTVEDVMHRFAQSLELVKAFVQEFLIKFNSCNYIFSKKLDLNACCIGGNRPDWFEILEK